MPYPNKVTATQSWQDIPTCKSQGLDVEYLMLRGIFMPPGVTQEQVDFYVDLFKKVRALPEWKKFTRGRRVQRHVHDRQGIRRLGRPRPRRRTSTSCRKPASSRSKYRGARPMTDKTQDPAGGESRPAGWSSSRRSLIVALGADRRRRQPSRRRRLGRRRPAVRATSRTSSAGSSRWPARGSRARRCSRGASSPARCS